MNPKHSPSEQPAPYQLPSLQLGGEAAATKSNAIEIPQITLPKGGGALKGIDEKFEVNAANGTASFSIPLPLSPGRNGFQPALALSYNSGAGNSLFGLGWEVGFPSIQRKTDKRLPRYRDYEDGDTFMFTGVEDLVPVLMVKGEAWTLDELANGSYVIRRYQPRIEGAFSRIERIWKKDAPTFYWKVTTRDNVVTFFGKSDTHRIADPNDQGRVFQWLPELSFDDKGNCLLFEFKAEDLIGVLKTPHEANRFHKLSPLANKHFKSVRYGNKTPFYPKYVDDPQDWKSVYETSNPNSTDFLFEVVFDYGEHGSRATAWEGMATVQHAETQPWPARHDAFSHYRSGFEIRTYRLCRRVLMFHHFQELGNTPCLVRSLDLEYRDWPQRTQPEEGKKLEVTYLEKITQRGYVREEGYAFRYKSLPSSTFSYQELQWNRTIQEVASADLVNAPVGLSSGYQWTDFYGEGLPGIFTEQADGWYYKSNLGNGQFTPAQAVMPKPSFTGLAEGVLQLQDLEADGRKQIVVNSRGLQGYFELTDDKGWENFQAFTHTANIDLRDPNIRLLDLNGDGQPEIVLSEERVFTWFPAAGTQGYDAPELTPKPFDEERGPALVFAERLQTVFLADMSGDGLTDLVRIRNGEVCYWPNLGYGRFGAKVTMSDAPLFDTPDQFNPAYLHLADVSGAGATDLLYLGQDRFRAWLNLSGNGWSAPVSIDPFPPTAPPGKLDVIDLLGQGTSCIVWSSPLPGQPPLRYIDLMGGVKPHIMTEQRNGMGKITRVTYKSSAHFYLEDKKNDAPWITKLPFPVQCVEKVEIIDEVADLKFTHSYAYHHGYYDHPEREFRGFGRVEQTDTEDFNLQTGALDADLYQPLVLTKTWFHTGAFTRKDSILRQFETEYYQDGLAHHLPDARIETLDPGYELSPEEYREALRACKGMALRQEVYALDDKPENKHPYSVAEHNCHITLLQARKDNAYAVFLPKESEAITYQYERNPADPRIAHTLNLAYDDQGNALQSVAVVYARQVFPADLMEQVKREQLKNHLIYTEGKLTGDKINEAAYRLRLPFFTQTWELQGFAPAGGAFYRISDFDNLLENTGIVERRYEEGFGGGQENRLIESIKTLYLADDLTTKLKEGEHDFLGFPYEAYQLAFNTHPDGGDSLISRIFKQPTTPAHVSVNEAMLVQAGYIKDGVQKGNDLWWIRSGRAHFPANAKDHFYSADRYEDPLGSKATVEVESKYHLYIKKITDELGNVTEIEDKYFDFRTLSPRRMKDLNDNETEVVTDALGLVVATAVRGKRLNSNDDPESGDHLKAYKTELTAAELSAFLNDPKGQANALLGTATTRLVYDFSASPAWVASIARETHGDPNTKTLIGFEYTAGLGQVVLKKVQAEPGKGWKINKDPDTGKCVKPEWQDADPRWIGNGRTILNNKGNPVRQYEPYFSVTHHYEEEACVREIGVTPILHYDPLGRVIRTDFPDGTFTKVEFTPWEQRVYDQNDTVRDSAWFEKANAADPGSPLKKAAFLAGWHHDTPAVLHTDSLGRPFFSVAHNKWRERTSTGYGPDKEEFYTTSVELDIEGNQRSVTDARGNVVMSWKYDMLGHQLFQHSMDAGERWMLHDCMGKPMLAWDVNEFQETGNNREKITENRHYLTEYDALHRPIAHWLGINDVPKQMIERFDYADTRDSDPQAKRKNLLGQLIRHYDSVGLLETLQCDFKGNTVEVKRQLTSQYRAPVIDWATAPQTKLENESFVQITEYDGLNRMSRSFPWHKGLNSRVAVYLPEYNERGALKKEDLVVRARKIKDGYEMVQDVPGLKGTRRTTVIEKINYNAKGQKELLKLGNGTITRYQYDPETFRLTQLRTTLPNYEPDFPQYRSGLNDPNIVQQLHYTYDPVGNITEIYDEAYEPVFFKNQKVEPRSRYEYDALYRLIAAEGREQYGATGTPPQKTGPAPEVNFPIHQPNDPNGLRNYTQRYTYDSVGNIEKMQHIANGGSWTRNYQYDDLSNRLLHTATNNPASAVDYSHDTHGNMLNYRDTSEKYHLCWDYRDMIRYLNLEGGGQAWYNYDAGKERSRKVIETSNGVKQWERFYLGGLEIYRRYAGGAVVEEIESLHLFEGEQRVLLVDDVLTTDNNQLPTGPLCRYQYGNHLGSVGLELNERAAIISYEEYHPYGTTAYQAVNAGVKSVAKRYRYTGMERDEETGMAYHSARYYLPWLGRWGSCDALGLISGTNLFRYSQCNPIRFIDLTGHKEQDKQSSQKSIKEFDEKTYVPNRDPTQLELNVKDLPQKIKPFISDLDRQRAKEQKRDELQWRAASLLASIGITLIAPEALLLLGLEGTTVGTMVIGISEVSSEVLSDYGMNGNVDPQRVAESYLISTAQKTFLNTMPDIPSKTAQNSHLENTISFGERIVQPHNPQQTTKSSLGGQRIFYVDTNASAVAIRTEGNKITFDTETDANFVQLALEVASRKDPGGHIYVGSGTHGSATGDWAATNSEFIEYQFYKEDLNMTSPPKLPQIGPRYVINVGAIEGQASFRKLEQSAANAPPGTLKSIAAWCFSSFRK